MPVRHRTFFPPSPFFCGGPECFRGTTKEPQAARLPLQRLASGKLYPVTAAQLLPIFTGFLAPIHFFKLAKNWDRGLAACAPKVKII
jgi:hypothetical protein